MMSPERAQWILANPLNVWGEFAFSFASETVKWGEHYTPGLNRIRLDGITEREDFFIRTIWMTMPGDTSYHDVVVKIAKGI